MIFQKKADMGIGTLIIFIAMILVAAIAAGVLIQTATTLQSRALETGKRSTSEISTAINTILVSGEDASINRSIDLIRHQIKLVAGSDPIKFMDTVLTLDLNDNSRDYIYNSTALCDSVANSSFSVMYIKNGSSHINGYLVLGDVVELCYKSPRLIHEDEQVRLNIIPKVGSVMTVSFNVPSTMISKRIIIYP